MGPHSRLLYNDNPSANNGSTPHMAYHIWGHIVYAARCPAWNAPVPMALHTIFTPANCLPKSLGAKGGAVRIKPERKKTWKPGRIDVQSHPGWFRLFPEPKHDFRLHIIALLSQNQKVATVYALTAIMLSLFQKQKHTTQSTIFPQRPYLWITCTVQLPRLLQLLTDLQKLKA